MSAQDADRHYLETENFIKAYELEREWAARHRISRRTSARYRAQPDGLPYLLWGGEIYIPKTEGARWIASLVTQRNPSRTPRQNRNLKHRENKA